MSAPEQVQGEHGEPTLNRVMGPGLLLLFVVGDILGTGVYALTGKVAAEVGGAVWLPFLVAFLGSPIWALVLLVGLKTVADLAAHLAERRRAGVRARAEGVELYRTPGRTVWS